jgi:hypothetical protein
MNKEDFKVGCGNIKTKHCRHLKFDEIHPGLFFGQNRLIFEYSPNVLDKNPHFLYRFALSA